MYEKPGVLKLLKWLGVAALVAVPVVVFLKKRKSPDSGHSVDDDSSNIFAAELSE